MNILESILNNSINIGLIILCLCATLLMSVLFSVLYCVFKQKEGYNKDIPVTLIILPLMITGITLVIYYASTSFTGDELSTRFGRVAIALVAAFVMIRFRSQQRSAEDLTYIFFLVGIGLINGLGYLFLGSVLYLFILAAFIIIYLTHFPFISKRNLNLKITIPEDLNFENAFDDLFDQYTSFHELTKIKSSDMGTMFVLSYSIVMKPNKSTKEFIDHIRERNGNLNVVITMKKHTIIE